MGADARQWMNPTPSFATGRDGRLMLKQYRSIRADDVHYAAEWAHFWHQEIGKAGLRHEKIARLKKWKEQLPAKLRILDELETECREEIKLMARLEVFEDAGLEAAMAF